MFQKQVFGLTGELRNIQPDYLQLITDVDMVRDQSKKLEDIISISIDSLNKNSFTYTLVEKDKRTIDINLQYTKSFIYRDATLTIQIPEAIKDSEGKPFNQNSYVTQIQFVIKLTDAEETIYKIMPYVIWGLYGIFLLCAVSLFVTKIDTVSIWIIIEFFQICGLFNYLNILKAKPLTSYLSELNKCNFFFIPTWYYNLIYVFDDTIKTQSSDIFIHDKEIQRPISTSYIRTTGNALFLIAIYTLLTLIFSFKSCNKLQSIFNYRSLFRFIDVLLIHFVFACVINIRFYSFDGAYQICDLFLSIITLIAYFFYSTIIPCSKVNDIDIIMLKKEAIERNKHFINKVRVEYFFSRNYFFFRNFQRYIITVCIAFFTLNNSATGVIMFVVIIYYIIIFILNVRYQLYEDQRLNGLQFISVVSLFFLLLLFILFWIFQQFYSVVSRKSSSQIDSFYISFNQYISWTFVCFLFLSKIFFLACILSYHYSTRKDKIEFQVNMQKTQSQLNQNNLNDKLMIDINSVTSEEVESEENIYVKNNFNIQRDIEMTKQSKQFQNPYTVSTTQSQFIDNSQKSSLQQNKSQNLVKTNQTNGNSHSSMQQKQQLQQQQFQQKQNQQEINKQQQQQQQMQIKNSDKDLNLNHPKVNNSSSPNDLEIAQQTQHDQEINHRFQNKTTTFSIQNNNNN